MKRSAVNRYIAEAAAFFAENKFILPPYAHWPPKAWASLGAKSEGFRSQRLGWDVTDFGSGDFFRKGLTLFTLRNGSPPGINPGKCYAEKIMLVRANQVTPFHYHARKTEDIINRGGSGAGSLAVHLYHRNEADGFADRRVQAICDGVSREVEAGGMVVLGPGESITLPPYLYHSFYAVGGFALIGEVSSFNDDESDNYFYKKTVRYVGIEEDEPPLRLLCTEYPELSL
jgi:hypothetical protein